MLDMICPCLTYLDMQKATAVLGNLFGLEIVWLSDDAAEIQWNGGVAVAQTDQPEMLHGSHVGHGWTYVRVAATPTAITTEHSAEALTFSTSRTRHRTVSSANTAPKIERETPGPSQSRSSVVHGRDSGRWSQVQTLPDPKLWVFAPSWPR
jgi:hypothetical protein